VYDLGGGTCDVTVLRRQPYGFDPIASDGLGDVGGLDVDAAVVAFLEATYGQLWTSAATRRQVWEDVRSAKEMLSRASSTVIMIPTLQKEVPLGREQLEGLARPVLRGTISMTRTLLVESGVPAGAIAGLFLVGGSSRIPLVATLLHEALGIPPVVAEQPELVVAEGAFHVRNPAASAPVSAVPVSPTPAMPVSPMPLAPMPISPMPASPVSPMPPFGGAPVGPPRPPVPPRSFPADRPRERRPSPRQPQRRPPPNHRRRRPSSDRPRHMRPGERWSSWRSVRPHRRGAPRPAGRHRPAGRPRPAQLLCPVRLLRRASPLNLARPTRRRTSHGVSPEQGEPWPTALPSASGLAGRHRPSSIGRFAGSGSVTRSRRTGATSTS